MAQSFFYRVRQWLGDSVRIMCHRLSQKGREHVHSELHFRRYLHNTIRPTWKQWRYARQILSGEERLIAKIACVLFIVGAAMLAVRAYVSFAVLVPARGGEYVEGAVGTPELINPILISANDVDNNVSRLVFSGLVRHDPEKGFVPDLADRFEISDDNKVYTFYLRRDILWHDGKPFSADDVIFTVKSIQNPKVKSPLLTRFSNVVIEKVDDATVRFHLDAPFSPFISVLTVGILPSHVWYDIAPAQMALSEYNIKPIGTGPYMFDAFKKDKRGQIHTYSLRAYDHFHRGRPFINAVTFKCYADIDEVIAALKEGNVDGISFLPRQQKEELRQKANVVLYDLNVPQYTALFINAKQNPLLEDKGIRLALAEAIDVPQLIQKVFGDAAQPVHGSLLPGMLGYDASRTGIVFHLDHARVSLSSLGWKEITGEELRAQDAKQQAQETAAQAKTKTAPQESDPPVPKDAWDDQPIYRQMKGNVLTITLKTVDRPDNRAVAEVIRDMWRALGVRVVLDIVSPQDIQQTVIPTRAYEVLLFTEMLGGDPDPYAFWHSSQREHPGLNLTSFASRQVDSLLEAGRSLTDPAKRTQKYQEFERALDEEFPAIFLYHQQYTYPLTRAIHGFKGDRIAVPADRFTNIEEWYLKTKRQIQLP